MSSFASFLKSYPAKLVILAVLYILAGKCGLMLAVPPGYATMIWPPSGIALGMLIMHGRKLWPGVLIGSFVLNAANGGAWSPADGIVVAKALVAFGIAAGSTLQAVFGYLLVRRFVGLPLQLKHFRDLGRLFLVCGPVACLVAASAGVATLYMAGVLPTDKIAGNWLAWWVGDLAGIVVVLPLMLVAPGSDRRITWRGEILGRMPAIAMLMVLLPLGLTFYAWKITSENAYEQSRSRFTTLAVENEKALQQRLNSYSNALVGASAFWQGSQTVSHQEWHTYVETLDLAHNYPGISGIGWIQPMTTAGLPALDKAMRADGLPGFTVHPVTASPTHDVITYLEPKSSNQPAEGLDITFEPHRLEAAERSRDTGLPTMTRKIVLVQASRKTPAFLLLQPVYRHDVPRGTVTERRAALRGWIYAPFIADNLLAGLTQSQADTLNLRIYDGGNESDDALIYDSRSEGAKTAPEKTAPEQKAQEKTSPVRFSVRKTLVVGQNSWLVVWDSTAKFEHAERQFSPVFVLVGGLLFTVLFAVFVIVVSPRRSETLRLLAVEHRLVLPSLIFVVLAVGSVVLFATLKDKERAYVHALIARDVTQTELLMASQTNDRIAAMQRLAGRWDIAGGTPFVIWQFDARNYKRQLAGLEAVQWIDKSGHVRWIEPLSGNEDMVGAAVAADATDAAVLKAATASDSPVFMPARETKPGHATFTSYFPVTAGGQPDGFVAAVFSVDDFFRNATARGNRDVYQIVMNNNGRNFVLTDPSSPTAASSWAVTRKISIGGQLWSFRVVPSQAFIASQQSPLPVIALMAGMVIAALSALALHALLLSRLRAVELESSHARLKASEASYRLLAENVPGMIGYWDKDLRCQFANNAYIEWFGKDPGALIGQSSRDVVGEALDEANRYIDGVLAGERQSFERRITRSSGESADTWAQYLPDYDDDGKVIGFYVMVTDITVLKQKEMALRESDALKEAVLSSTEYLVIATTTDGVVTVFNEAAERALGYKARDVLGRKVNPAWHLRDEIIARTQQLNIELADVLASPLEPGFETFSILAMIDGKDSHEWTYVRKDGSTFTARVNITPLRAQDQRINGYLGVIEDVTERRAAAKALRESNSLKSAVVSSTQYMVVATTLDGTVTVFNEAAEAALGYSADEVVNIQTPALWHDKDEVIARTAELNAELGTDIEPGFATFAIKADKVGSDEHEWTLIRKDGSRFPALVAATPLKGEDGRTTGYLNVIDDIAERKAQDLALRTSEETFRQAMENTSVGMAITSPDGRWLRANPAICDMLGYSEAEFLAQDFRSVTHPDDLQVTLDNMARLLDGAVRSFQIEKRYVHKDGHIVWTLLTTSLVRHADGTPNYFVSHVHDITERREMERMKSEFISIVSHELRTPLTSIRGSLGLLAGTLSDTLSDKANRLVQLAFKNSERLILLINDILDMDKIASGQMTFHLKDESLAELLRQSVEANQPYAEKFSVTLAAAPVPAGLRVRVDAARFQQVLANLLSNAAKFSPPGSSVDIAVTTVGDQARITVSDRGPGIPEAFKHRIFGRFSQADSSNTRDQAGTGLGLHISQQIVRQMEGDIGFESVTGAGSTFWVSFPAKAVAAPAVPAQDDIGDLPHILHVEDDLDLSQFLASALGDRARLTTATTVKDALRMVEDKVFDMYILDVVLPDGSGLQVLEHLGGSDRRGAPVVILSAQDVPPDIRNQVSASIVKSRDSEAKMIATLLGLLDAPRPKEAA